MNDIALRESPAPMEGHGVYNGNSGVQAAGLVPALPLFERAARDAPLAPAPEAIVIADYGSSEGYNSLPPMRVAIRELRRRAGNDRAISVVHTDQPDNDFSSLFEMLESDPDSYMRGDPRVFASGVGRSFYEQIFPPDSVTLGWSSWSVQWLSRRPVPVRNHVSANLSGDPEVKAAFARQAAEDWRRFLMCRGRELRPGGGLVVVTVARDEAGRSPCEPVSRALNAALLDLAETGLITREELRRMALPTVARSREEWHAPFAPHGHFAGLAIEDFQIFHAKDHFWDDFVRNHDAAALGARWAGFFRALAFPTLATGLNGGGASPRVGEFVLRLEAAMAARLAAAPEQVALPTARMLLVKRAA
jgi:hypothetical protein